MKLKQSIKEDPYVILYLFGCWIGYFVSIIDNIIQVFLYPFGYYCGLEMKYISFTHKLWIKHKIKLKECK